MPGAGRQAYLQPARVPATPRPYSAQNDPAPGLRPERHGKGQSVLQAGRRSHHRSAPVSQGQKPSKDLLTNQPLEVKKVRHAMMASRNAKLSFTCRDTTAGVRS